MTQRTVLLLAALTWTAVLLCGEIADAARRSAMIVSPKRDKVVKREHEVIGKLSAAGQPVVLVRADRGDGTWWVQPAVTFTERGYFRTKVRFGGAASKRGDRFWLVVVVLRSEFEAELFKDRDSLPELPETLSQSEPIPVVLGEDASTDRAPAAVTAAILKPRQGEKVQRVTDVLGRTAENLQPVVLVRVDTGGGLWWVQDPVQLGKGGYFKARVRCGNDTTPSGTRFRIVVATPRSGQESAQLKSGMSLPSLPAEIPRSKVITVELQRPDTKKGRGTE